MTLSLFRTLLQFHTLLQLLALVAQHHVWQNRRVEMLSTFRAKWTTHNINRYFIFAIYWYIFIYHPFTDITDQSTHHFLPPFMHLSVLVSNYAFAGSEKSDQLWLSNQIMATSHDMQTGKIAWKMSRQGGTNQTRIVGHSVGNHCNKGWTFHLALPRADYCDNSAER